MLRDYIQEQINRVEREKRLRRLEESGKYALIATVGALVGAAAGVLFAPQAGKDTREDIKNTAIEAGQNIADSVNETYGNVKATTNEAIETAKNKYDEFASKNMIEIANTADKVGAKANEIAKKLSDNVDEAGKEVENKAEEVADKARKEAKK